MGDPLASSGEAGTVTGVKGSGVRLVSSEAYRLIFLPLFDVAHGNWASCARSCPVIPV